MFCGQLERYEKAIEIFEQVAKDSLGNKLLKYSAKDYFLKGGLMHLCLVRLCLLVLLFLCCHQ